MCPVTCKVVLAKSFRDQSLKKEIEEEEEKGKKKKDLHFVSFLCLDNAVAQSNYGQSQNRGDCRNSTKNTHEASPNPVAGTRASISFRNIDVLERERERE